MVTEEENASLLSFICGEEAIVVVKDLDKDSAAGLDGFSNFFCQDGWPAIGSDLIVAIGFFH